MERAEISQFGCPTVTSQHAELKSLMFHELKLTGGERDRFGLEILLEKKKSLFVGN